MDYAYCADEPDMNCANAPGKCSGGCTTCWDADTYSPTDPPADDATGNAPLGDVAGPATDPTSPPDATGNPADDATGNEDEGTLADAWCTQCWSDCEDWAYCVGL